MKHEKKAFGKTQSLVLTCTLWCWSGLACQIITRVLVRSGSAFHGSAWFEIKDGSRWYISLGLLVRIFGPMKIKIKLATCKLSPLLTVRQSGVAVAEDGRLSSETHHISHPFKTTSAKEKKNFLAAALQPRRVLKHKCQSAFFSLPKMSERRAASV